jgi:chitodextrinase
MVNGNRRMRVLCLSLAPLLAGVAAAAVAADAPPVSAASVVVTDPSVLPPPGSTVGWVDHPCSHDLLYVPDWYVNGQHFHDVFARAHNAILTDIGTPTMTTSGSDVLSTFAATLHVDASVVVGYPQDPPMPLALPGSITARFIGKAGKTTGTFLIKVETMSFQAALFGISLGARQDPAHNSTGSISVTAVGGNSYRVDCALDAYTQISIYNTQANPPEWLPYVSDSDGPVHFELRASTCPPANYPFAAFTLAPTPVKVGHAVTFTDASTGGPTQWAWNFGDATSSAQRNPTHTFAAAGTYAVRLTVTNAYGSDSYGTLLTVTGPPGPHQVHRVLPKRG